MTRCLLTLVQRHVFFLCIAVIIGFFSVLACSAEPLVFELPLLPEDTSYISVLEKEFRDSYLVERVCISSDIVIQEEEIRYLMGIAEGMLVSCEDIKRGCSHLQKKHKFEHMQLHVLEGVTGKILNINLRGAWTFGRVYIQGLLLGKDAYKQYYFLESGELFNIKKHQDSCRKIESMLYDQGYFNGCVADYLSYDRTTKTVHSKLVIDRGNRFMIDAVHVMCGDTSVVDGMDAILNRVHELFATGLLLRYFSADLVNNEASYVKKYLAKKGFMNASLLFKKHFDRSHHKVTVTFSVILHQKREFIFFGNHFFSKEELLEMILVFGRSAWLLPPEILKQEVEQRYQDKGFWQIQIEPKQEEERIFFLISEGPRASIGEVDIQGVDLPADINSLKKLCSPCLEAGFYQESLLRSVLSSIRAWYEQKGCWETRILSQEFVPLEKRDTYKLVLAIDEGTPYYLADVQIEGFPQLRNSGPFAAISPDAPQLFDTRMLEEQRAWLVGYMRTHGYLYAKITSELVFEGSLVKVIWHISGCQEQVTFGKTIVRGTVPFPFKHVLSHLEYREHDVWNGDQLEKSVLQFRDLGIFETIHIFPYNIANTSQDKLVILKLVEDNPFEVRLRAGFQQVSKNFAFKSGSTYKFGASCVWKNPFQAADQCIFNADVTKFYRDVVAVYHRPWLWDIPLHMLVKGYAHKYIQPVFLGSDRPLYTAVQTGILLGLRRHVPHVDMNYTMGFEVMETRGLSQDIARAINFEPSLIDKKVPALFFEPSLFIDFLDNDLNPSAGFYSALSCRGVFPWKKDCSVFLKVLLEQAHFLSIKSVVCALRVRCGHIFKQEFRNIMPPDRFYLGGENSIRSINKDMAPPLGEFRDKNGEILLVPQGGKSMVNGNLELRLPVFKDFGIVLFQDIGTLIEKSLAEVTGGKLLIATGFGLRYHTPVGPFRFDIGWRWNRQYPTEPTYSWYLTLGNAF